MKTSYKSLASMIAFIKISSLHAKYLHIHKHICIYVFCKYPSKGFLYNFSWRTKSQWPPCFPVRLSALIVTLSWQFQRLLFILILSSFYSECKERPELQFQSWKAGALISELCSPSRAFQHFDVFVESILFQSILFYSFLLRLPFSLTKKNVELYLQGG